MAFENPFKRMPKPALYATIGGSVLVFGYMGYKHHQSTGSWNPFSGTTGTTSAGNPTSIDPVTGLAYSQDSAIDPLTNLAYLAEAQQYGSVAAAEAAVSAYGQSTASGSGIGVNPASPGSSGSPNTTVGGSVYTSNSAWAQAVQAGLTDVGYNPTDVAQALGLYLTGQPMTKAQAQLINTAIAEYGAAPVGNLQIIIAPDHQPGPTMVDVPDVVGKTAGEAFNTIKAAGLVLVNPDASGAGEPADKVVTQSPSAGTQVTKGSKVTIHTAAGKPPPPIHFPPNDEVTVPHVIGESQALAFDDLQEAGLKAKGSRVVKGSVVYVVSQNPKAGTKVKRGTTVHLVSKERKAK